MPNLVNVQLQNAFQSMDSVTITGSNHSIPFSHTDIGVLKLFMTKYWECWSAEPVPSSITELVIGNWKCNDARITELDLSKYPMLKSVTIGSDSFMYVNEVKMIGMSELKSVVIGMNSFTRCKNTYEVTPNPNRYFHLKDCPKLKSLEIDRYSFSDYTVCGIENVDALEVLEIGKLGKYSENFQYASLELKSAFVLE